MTETEYFRRGAWAVTSSRVETPRADFELVVEPHTFVPDRIIAIVMRQELETHFRIVKQKALEQAKR